VQTWILLYVMLAGRAEKPVAKVQNATTTSNVGQRDIRDGGRLTVPKRLNQHSLHEHGFHADSRASLHAEYGEQIARTLAALLTAGYGRRLAEKSLRRMVQFSVSFPDESIVATLSRQLSWSQVRVGEGYNRRTGFDVAIGSEMFEGDLIRPLGLVALNCGYAERELDELLTALSYLGPFDPAMRQGTVGQKVALAERLIRDAHQEVLLADLLDALAEARRLFEQRNALLHGCLLAGGRLVSNRRGIPVQHVTPEDLTHLSEFIFACKERIWLARCKYLSADSRPVTLNRPLASASAGFGLDAF